jgi:hypothetical protein
MSTWDPVKLLVTEMRGDAAVQAIAGQNPSVPAGLGARVRAPKAAPGDANGPSAYRAHVVITTLALPRHPQVPIQRARHVVHCRGRTPEEAEALYVACSAVVHAVGPRLHGSGQGIYVTHDDTGGEFARDPDTQQPTYTFILETVATTQVLA